jgi:hypothetical protein
LSNRERYHEREKRERREGEGDEDKLYGGNPRECCVYVRLRTDGRH